MRNVKKRHREETPREKGGICPVNTFVPTIFRHTLIFAASRKLAPLALRQCSSGKAKYIEKSLHSLSFSGQIPPSSLGCVLATIHPPFFVNHILVAFGVGFPLET